MVRHQKRGIDIPGGHLDAGETPIQALTREVLEEASVTLDDVQPAGAVVVRQLDSGIATKYPALSQMRMYSALVRELLPFDSSRETLDRLFIPPRTLPQHHHAWNPAFQSVLEACIRDRIGEHAG